MFTMSASRIAAHITWKNLASGVVLLNLDTSDYYTLNEVASLIWREVAEGTSREGILERILDEYDCNADEARADLDAQLGHFLEEGLLEDVPLASEGR
jgi:hypothetical protein